MSQTDQQLWEAFRKGDQPSFARLYKRYYADLYFYSLKLTQDPAIAEDVIHDTFIYMWQNRKRLGRVTSLKFYLLRSVRNQCLRQLQKKQKVENIEQVYESIVFRVQPQELKLKDTSEEVRIRIEMALEELSPRQREIIHLKYFENLDYQEIAELFSINYQSVVNLVHRAIVKLREADVLKFLDNG